MVQSAVIEKNGGRGYASVTFGRFSYASVLSGKWNAEPRHYYPPAPYCPPDIEKLVLTTTTTSPTEDALAPEDNGIGCTNVDQKSVLPSNVVPESIQEPCEDMSTNANLKKESARSENVTQRLDNTSISGTSVDAGTKKPLMPATKRNLQQLEDKENRNSNGLVSHIERKTASSEWQTKVPITKKAKHDKPKALTVSRDNKISTQNARQQNLRSNTTGKNLMQENQGRGTYQKIQEARSVNRVSNQSVTTKGKDLTQADQAHKEAYSNHLQVTPKIPTYLFTRPTLVPPPPPVSGTFSYRDVLTKGLKPASPTFKYVAVIPIPDPANNDSENAQFSVEKICEYKVQSESPSISVKVGEAEKIVLSLTESAENECQIVKNSVNDNNDKNNTNKKSSYENDNSLSTKKSQKNLKNSVSPKNVPQSKEAKPKSTPPVSSPSYCPTVKSKKVDGLVTNPENIKGSDETGKLKLRDIIPVNDNQNTPENNRINEWLNSIEIQRSPNKNDEAIKETLPDYQNAVSGKKNHETGNISPNLQSKTSKFLNRPQGKKLLKRDTRRDESVKGMASEYCMISDHPKSSDGRKYLLENTIVNNVDDDTVDLVSIHCVEATPAPPPTPNDSYIKVYKKESPLELMKSAAKELALHSLENNACVDINTETILDKTMEGAAGNITPSLENDLTICTTSLNITNISNENVTSVIAANVSIGTTDVVEIKTDANNSVINRSNGCAVQISDAMNKSRDVSMRIEDAGRYNKTVDSLSSASIKRFEVSQVDDAKGNEPVQNHEENEKKDASENINSSRITLITYDKSSQNETKLYLPHERSLFNNAAERNLNEPPTQTIDNSAASEIYGELLQNTGSGRLRNLHEKVYKFKGKIEREIAFPDVLNTLSKTENSDNQNLEFCESLPQRNQETKTLTNEYTKAHNEKLEPESIDRVFNNNDGESLNYKEVCINSEAQSISMEAQYVNTPSNKDKSSTALEGTCNTISTEKHKEHDWSMKVNVQKDHNTNKNSALLETHSVPSNIVQTVTSFDVNNQPVLNSGDNHFWSNEHLESGGIPKRNSTNIGKPISPRLDSFVDHQSASIIHVNPVQYYKDARPEGQIEQDTLGTLSNEGQLQYGINTIDKHITRQPILTSQNVDQESIEIAQQNIQSQNSNACVMSSTQSNFMTNFPAATNSTTMRISEDTQSLQQNQAINPNISPAVTAGITSLTQNSNMNSYIPGAQTPYSSQTNHQTQDAEFPQVTPGQHLGIQQHPVAFVQPPPPPPLQYANMFDPRWVRNYPTDITQQEWINLNRYTNSEREYITQPVHGLSQSMNMYNFPPHMQITKDGRFPTFNYPPPSYQAGYRPTYLQQLPAFLQRPPPPLPPQFTSGVYNRGMENKMPSQFPQRQTRPQRQSPEQREQNYNGGQYTNDADRMGQALPQNQNQQQINKSFQNSNLRGPQVSGGLNTYYNNEIRPNGQGKFNRQFSNAVPQEPTLADYIPRNFENYKTDKHIASGTANINQNWKRGDNNTTDRRNYGVDRKNKDTPYQQEAESNVVDAAFNQGSAKKTNLKVQPSSSTDLPINSNRGPPLEQKTGTQSTFDKNNAEDYRYGQEKPQLQHQYIGSGVTPPNMNQPSPSSAINSVDYTSNVISAGFSNVTRDQSEKPDGENTSSEYNNSEKYNYEGLQNLSQLNALQDFCSGGWKYYNDTLASPSGLRIHQSTYVPYPNQCGTVPTTYFSTNDVRARIQWLGFKKAHEIYSNRISTEKTVRMDVTVVCSKGSAVCCNSDILGTCSSYFYERLFGRTEEYVTIFVNVPSKIMKHFLQIMSCGEAFVPVMDVNEVILKAPIYLNLHF